MFIKTRGNLVEPYYIKPKLGIHISCLQAYLCIFFKLTFSSLSKKDKNYRGWGGGKGAWVFRSTGGMGRDPKNCRGLSFLGFQKFPEIGVINWKQNSQTNFNMQM